MKKNLREIYKKEYGINMSLLSDDFEKPVYEEIMGIKVKSGYIVLVGGYSGTGKTHWLIKATKFKSKKKNFHIA